MKGKTMTKDEAKALLVKCAGNKSQAARRAGISRRTFARLLERGAAQQVSKPPVVSSSVQARSLSDFRQTYDKETIIPRAVQSAFKQLGSGWVYEAEFVKLAGIALKDLAIFRDRYADHLVVVADHRRIWVGKTRVAEEMRRMV
jgi:hypothetical protein